MKVYYISTEWWANILTINRCLLIGCALGAPDEGIFMDRIALELTGAEAGGFEFESDQVYNDIAHFVGDVNTWEYVTHASYQKRMNEELGPACLCVENIDDESYDIVGVRNGHLVVQESDGWWYGHVIGRPHNYAEALAWVTAHTQS